MIVISMVDCPPGLRGDLTKWLLEISAGVFVGQVSARVRDQLWERIEKNVARGRVTMVYNANNEQRLAFRVHNASWQPIDFDGLKLMLRPSPNKVKPAFDLRPGFSNASRQLAAKRAAKKQEKPNYPTDYVVIDIETTGLVPAQHEIIELGALRVCEGEPAESFSALIRPQREIPAQIARITGLSTTLLAEQGVDAAEGLATFLTFLGDRPIVGHNLPFDLAFLRQACTEHLLDFPTNPQIDTLPLAKRLLRSLPNHRLETLSAHLGTPAPTHRTSQDCLATQQVYAKLIKMSDRGQSKGI